MSAEPVNFPFLGDGCRSGTASPQPAVHRLKHQKDMISGPIRTAAEPRRPLHPTEPTLTCPIGLLCSPVHNTIAAMLRSVPIRSMAVGEPMPADDDTQQTLSFQSPEQARLGYVAEDPVHVLLLLDENAPPSASLCIRCPWSLAAIRQPI